MSTEYYVEAGRPNIKIINVDTEFFRSHFFEIGILTECEAMEISDIFLSFFKFRRFIFCNKYKRPFVLLMKILYSCYYNIKI